MDQEQKISVKQSAPTTTAGSSCNMIRNQFVIQVLLSIAFVFALATGVIAQSEDSSADNQSEQSSSVDPATDDAAKQAANPLATAWLIQFQQNNDWVEVSSEADKRVQSNMQFQPLMSMGFTDNWALIMRPVAQLYSSAPYVDQETGQNKRVTGLGDTVFAFALSPGKKLVGNWLLAAGATSIFPTATETFLGQDEWQLGPTGAVGYMGQKFIAYIFPQQWFSIGGSGRKVSQMSAQYAFVYFLENGWSVGTNPNIFVNWEATSGNKLTFPVALQVGKLLKVGILPVKLDMQVQYNAVRPDINGPKWKLQLQITPILPSLIKGNIF